MSTVPPATGPSRLTAGFLADVWAGLAGTPKALPSKYFYDARGSALFEAICRQPEYYLTRAELALMQAHAADIARALGPDVAVVEYGTGSGAKTGHLLAALQRPAAYVPVEISASALEASTRHLARRFPGLRLLPVCADFSHPLVLPALRARRTVVYFPGSTLGNFDTAAATELLAGMHRHGADGRAALIGVDRIKATTTLEAAYNDAAGLTAAFTLNLLARINHELRGDFDLSAFAHRAVYSVPRERIETDLVSRRTQAVCVAGRRFEFGAGEATHVEVSTKYSTTSFARLAASAGWRLARRWSDPQQRFDLYLLEPAAGSAG